MGGLMWVGKWWKLNQPWTIRGKVGMGGQEEAFSGHVQNGSSN